MSRDQLVQEILANVSSLRRALVKCGNQNVQLMKFTPGQRELLFTIWHNGGHMTVKDIAAAINVSPSAATQLVDSLVVQDFLERTTDVNDRRIVHISISATGKKQFSAMKKRQVELLKPIFSELDESELETFQELTEKILKANILKTEDNPHA